MEPVREYFNATTLVDHQIHSFNFFVSHLLQQIIDESDSIVCNRHDDECTIRFKAVSLDKVNHTESNGQQLHITPHEARLRNLTYSANLYVDIEIKHNDETKLYERCELGKLPIMVRSDYCRLVNTPLEQSNECSKDPGGYFIVSGTEKVIVSHEKMNNNCVYVFDKQKTKIVYEVEKTNGRTAVVCQDHLLVIGWVYP